MKKFILSLFILFVFTLSICLAESLIYSADKTADALIRTGKTNFFSILVIDDATNNVTVDIYDGTSTAGTKIVQSITFVANAANPNHVLSFDPPIICNDGIYVDITTAGTTTYKVYYNTKSH